jgi:hypothetical protein
MMVCDSQEELTVSGMPNSIPNLRSNRKEDKIHLCYTDQLVNPLKITVPPDLTVNKSAFLIYAFRAIISVNKDYFLKKH